MPSPSGMQGYIKYLMTYLRIPYLPQTASYTTIANFTQGYYTNTGASGTITISLPSSALPGITYTFVCTVAQAIRVDPAANDRILVNNALQAAGKYASVGAINAGFTLTSLGDGIWLATGVNGTVTVEA